MIKLNSVMTDSLNSLLCRIEKGELKSICRRKHEDNELFRKRIYKAKKNIGKMVGELDKEEKILREYFLLSNASKHINCECFNNCKYMRPCVSNIMICSTFRNYLRKILNDKIN